MLCDVCHTREARIMYTEIINGQKREQHLCESCASEQTLNLTNQLGGEIPIGSILSGIMQNYAKGIAAKSANEPVCMRCGMTASELVKGGRLGCPECYTAFTMILDKNLKTVQGAVEHHGKVPANAKKIEVKPAAKVIRTAADVMKEATDEIVRNNSGVRRKKNEEDALVVREDAAEQTVISGAETVDKASGRAEQQVLADKEKYSELLKQALANEDYEEAARLRDLIRGDGNRTVKKVKSGSADAEETATGTAKSKAVKKMQSASAETEETGENTVKSKSSKKSPTSKKKGGAKADES